MARFITLDEAAARLRGRTVAVVGSAPSVLRNEPGYVDGHDVVVRVNNYKLGGAAGRRTDVHYSFFGGSIKKTAEELQRDGVTLCWCKCPNDRPIESEWHMKNGMEAGIDFRKIYQRRAGWWFGDVAVPTTEHFLRGFRLLGDHIPTSGFAAILDVLWSEPLKVYLTGFDFFASGLHNVNERWKPGRVDDPIKHVPEREAAWVRDHHREHPIELDKDLANLIKVMA